MGLSSLILKCNNDTTLHSQSLSPRPLEELRPRGAPTTVPPPRPINRRTAALFTDIEKFLCRKEETW